MRMINTVKYLKMARLLKRSLSKVPSHHPNTGRKDILKELVTVLDTKCKFLTETDLHLKIHKIKSWWNLSLKGQNYSQALEGVLQRINKLQRAKIVLRWNLIYILNQNPFKKQLQSNNLIQVNWPKFVLIPTKNFIKTLQTIK